MTHSVCNILLVLQLLLGKGGWGVLGLKNVGRAWYDAIISQSIRGW